MALAGSAAPLALFGIALIVRLAAASRVGFPISEGSAYYVQVASNLAAGRGLLIDSIWSYSTPPLVFPRPAFELWQPLASLVAAVPMGLLGDPLSAAQAAFAVLGAVLAPLAWYVARDLSDRLSLPPRRATMVSLGAGLLTAVTGPLVFAAAVPDSTLPFTVAAVAACVAMPAALRGDRRGIVALGALAGLAYLARMEAIYLALAFVGIGLSAHIAVQRLVALGAAVAAVAALAAAPWWLRNVSVFGMPFPAQAADNAFLTSNEQIFAWSYPPTLAGFLAQGPFTILGNIAEAFRHDVVDVLIVPAAVVALAGGVTLWTGRRRAGVLRGSPMGALLIVSAITLVVTSTVFPVATLWGTFEHAAGPLIVALCVLAAAGADAAVARVRQWRNWPRSNAWLAPAALFALTVPLTLVQLAGAANQARAEHVRVEGLATTVPQALDMARVSRTQPLITDRPIWLSNALNVRTLALPAEPSDSVLDLARTFDAHAVVVVEERGTYPAAFATDPCFTRLDGVADASLFAIAEACR
jgi:hypothetical protein